MRLHLNIGRNQQIAPNYIVAGIADGTGLPAKAIGKINIFNEYTEIDLSPEDAKYVLEKMKNSKIKGQRVQFTMLEGRTGGASGRYGRGGRRQSGDSFKSGGNRYQNKSSRYTKDGHLKSHTTTEQLLGIGCNKKGYRTGIFQCGIPFFD